MGRYNGRITKIEKSQFTSCILTQDISGKEQSFYDNSNKFHGSNGSYTSNFNTEYSVDLYLTIYEKKSDDSKKVKIDIRKSILEYNNLKRISSEKIDQIINDNVGKKVTFNIINNRIIFDEGELLL